VPPLIDLSDLEALIAVIDAGGFARAANRLGVSKSLVSRRISRLEKEMGVVLLSRNPRGFAATHAGEELAGRSRMILQNIIDARDAVAAQSGSVVGRIRLAVPMSFALRYLQPLFYQLHNTHPQLVLDICYSDSHVDLIAGQFDAAVRIGEPPEPGLFAQPLAEIELIAVASPAYLEVHGIPSDPQDLLNHACIVYSGSQQRQTWRFGSDIREVVVLPEGRFLADNGEALLDAAEAGLGIALLPDFLVKEGMRAGRLLRILMKYEPQKSCLYLASLPGSSGSARIRILQELLMQNFGSGQTSIRGDEPSKH
jgi:DNA-binding transcriptional LysR family regulator